MPAAILGPVIGSAVGGLMSDSGGGQQTQTKDPWGPAQKPLQNTLNTGQALETYYQQNPFNPLQQAGYQNLASDLDNFRNTMAPQAQAFNNRLMNTNYQRAPAGSELGGYQQIDASQFLPPEQRQAYGQMGQSGGLMSAVNGMQGMSAPTGGNAMSMLQALGQGGQGLQTKPMQIGLLSQPQQGMSVVAPNSQNYGLLNWSELNPYTATNGIPKTPPVDPNAKTPEETAMEEAARRERERQQNYGGS
jgi:hypothetical protein